MGRCPKCGVAYDAGDVYCRACGYDLRVAQQATMPIPVVQEAAEASVSAPAQQYERPQPSPPPQPPKKRRSGLVIGIVVGILLVCGLCALAGLVGYLRFMPVTNVIEEVRTSSTKVFTPAMDGGTVRVVGWKYDEDM